jgi:hypothetical protein
MLSIVQEEDPPRAPLHQERDQRSVCLGRVTIAAGEDQIVCPIICGLTPAGPHVVEGDRFFGCIRAAIRADGAVLGEQPIAMRLHGTTWGTAETGDGNCGMSSSSACHKLPS